MMLLGVLLHTAITYIVTITPGWSLKDPNTTSLFWDYLVDLVHLFRMPTFFVVGGFFGALLFYERSPRRMIVNRFKRIALPFIVFILLIFPFNQFSFGFTEMTFQGSTSAAKDAMYFVVHPKNILPTHTFHLWFLYYFGIISVFAFSIALIFKRLKSQQAFIVKVSSKIFQNPVLRMIVPMAMIWLFLIIFDISWVGTNTRFLPNFVTLMFYFLFYGFGWLLFRFKRNMKTLTNKAVLVFLVALIVFTIRIFLMPQLSTLVLAGLNAFCAWLFILSITGLFLKYLSVHSLKIRYISDASYWVYLIHLPIVVTISGLIFYYPIPSILKVIITTSLSSAVCFGTYHLFVRSTFIGKFLNGHKYSRKGNKRIG